MKSPEMKDTSSVPGDASHLIFYLYVCVVQYSGRKEVGQWTDLQNFETSVLSVCLWLNIVLYPIPQCQLLIKNV